MLETLIREQNRDFSPSHVEILDRCVERRIYELCIKKSAVWSIPAWIRRGGGLARKGLSHDLGEQTMW